MNESFTASTVQIVATMFFALAILHTFSVKGFQHLAHKYRKGSVGENFFHLLGEVEVVFGIWAGLFLVFLAAHSGARESIAYLEGRNFTEPMFVFVILTICSARPILQFSESLIDRMASLLPLNKSMAFYATALVLGPILGSFITEPAAMTVTALILLNHFYAKKISLKLKYATLGLLFVNISIGGTLTPYAAPPVLMVAPKWGWGLEFMIFNFGLKAILAIVISTTLVCLRFRSEISSLPFGAAQKLDNKPKAPMWVVMLHLLLLGGVVLGAHWTPVFVGVFLLFLGVVTVTKEFQTELKLREGLLVGFFLAGLVVLGGQQSWWLAPVLAKLEALPLFLSAIGLTAVTDNAALTYLGAQVESISEISKYALVAGAVVGGGLTVIANAPNPAGYGILNPKFGVEGINPLKLFLSALLPTVIAALCFWFL